jgi:hypothetical protein
VPQSKRQVAIDDVSAQRDVHRLRHAAPAPIHSQGTLRFSVICGGIGTSKKVCATSSGAIISSSTNAGRRGEGSGVGCAGTFDAPPLGLNAVISDVPCCGAASGASVRLDADRVTVVDAVSGIACICSDGARSIPIPE